MTKRALATLIAGILVVALVATVIASSVGGSDAATTHMMPNGQTMDGKDMNSGKTHTMSDGSAMDGADMNP